MSPLAVGILTAFVATDPPAMFSPDKAAGALDMASLAWTRSRKCGACHTNVPYLFARPVLGTSTAYDEVKEFFTDRAARWDRGQIRDAPRSPAEVVITAVAMALCDARVGKLDPLTRQALDRVWTLQQDDGSWNWLKCDWPPMEHDDYYGVVFVAIGVGAAPEGYATSASARVGLARIREFLTANPPPNLHHATMLLWAASKLEGLMTADERAMTIKALRDLQRADGGWCLPGLAPEWERRNGDPNDPNSPSDAYATGLVTLVLRQAGAPADDPALQKAVNWLKANQRESGRWFTRSTNTDRAHYISNAGTAFAVLALEACGALSQSPVRPRDTN